MLDLMRRKKRLKAILWLVILGLTLGMLLFFVPGSNIESVSPDTSAATVDGRSISISDYMDSYRRALDNYTNRGRNRIDAQTLKALDFPRRVLDSLITSKVVDILAERYGVKVTEAEIRKAVEKHPNLQEQGKFIGLERYKALLAANNLSIADFEDDVRYAELVKKLSEIITDSLDVSELELRDEFSRTSRTAQVDYVILKKEDFRNRVKPTEAELRAYFDEHKDTYKIKEKRRVQYLLVPLAQILPGIKVTENELLDEWDREPHEETVEAAHILFRVDDPTKDAEVKARAENVLKRARAGEDFSELARKYSEDDSNARQGGYLGSFQRGHMLKEFEDAAFSLKPGEISGLVRTADYGYHIIKVLRHETPTFESNRSSILNTVQNRKAQEIARLKAEEAVGLAEKQKDLHVAAKKLGIAAEVKETGFFTREDNPFAMGISAPLRDAAFELKQIGAIGKAVEHPLGYAVPKLLEVQLAKPAEFSTSRSQVEKDYIEKKSEELMQADARKLTEEARKQGSLQKAAKTMGLTVKTSQEFKRDGTPGSDIGTYAAFNEAAFELDPGSISNPISLIDKVSVLQVKSRSTFDESAYQKQKQEIRKRLLQAKQEPYFQEYLRKVTEELERAGKIRINPRALEQAEKFS